MIRSFQVIEGRTRKLVWGSAKCVRVCEHRIHGWVDCSQLLMMPALHSVERCRTRRRLKLSSEMLSNASGFDSWLILFCFDCRSYSHHSCVLIYLLTFTIYQSIFKHKITTFHETSPFQTNCWYLSYGCCRLSKLFLISHAHWVVNNTY